MIDHEFLIRKIKTYPAMEKQIRAWLKAPVIFYDPEEKR